MVNHLDTNHNHINEITTAGFACDIDETLSETGIPAFKEMMKQFGNPENLTPQEMMNKYDTLEEVPYWEKEKLHKKMNEYFGDTKTYLNLGQQTNAAEILREITKTIPLAAYITARKSHLHEASMKWLEKLGFPKAPILMNTAGDMINHRSSWKAELLKHLHPKIIGIIDDDKKLPSKLDPDYKGFLIMFGHNHTPQTNFEIHAAKDWKEVKTIFEKKLSQTHPSNN